MAIKIELLVDDKGTATVKNFSSTAKREIAGIESQTKSSTDAMSTSWTKLAGVVAGVFSVQAITSFFKKTIEYGNNLSNLSQRLSISTSELDKFNTIAEQSDLTLDNVVSAIQKMNREVIDSKRGVGDSRQIFQALNIDLERLSKLPLDKQFLEVAKAIESIENPTTKAYAAFKVWGISGTDILQMLPNLVENFDNLKSKMSPEAEKAANDLDQAIKDLHKELRDFGLVTLPKISESLKFINENFMLVVSTIGILIGIPLAKWFGSAIVNLAAMAGVTATAEKTIRSFLVSAKTGETLDMTFDKVTETTRWGKFTAAVSKAFVWLSAAVVAADIGYTIGTWINSFKEVRDVANTVMSSIHVGFVWLVGQAEILFYKMLDAWEKVVYKMKVIFWEGMRSLWDNVPGWVKSFLGMGEFNISAPEEFAGRTDLIKKKTEELNAEIKRIKENWKGVREEIDKIEKDQEKKTTTDNKKKIKVTLISEEDLRMLEKFTKEAQESLQQITPLEEALLTIDATLTRMRQEHDKNVSPFEDWEKAEIDGARTAWILYDNSEAAAALRASIATLTPEVIKLADSFNDQLIEALTEFIMGTKSAKEAFRDLLAFMARELLRSGLKQLMADIFGTSEGGLFGVLAKAISSIGTIGGGIGGGTAAAAEGFGSYIPVAASAAGMLQHGGPVSAYKPYMVGEAGPELFMPRTSGSIVPNDQLGKGGGRDIVINNTVNVNSQGGKTDPKDVERTGRMYKKMLKDAVKEVIMEEQRPMGMLNRGYA